MPHPTAGDTEVRRSSRRAVAGAVAAMVSASIPPFLVGALALEIGQDLDFGTSELGMSVASYYLSSAVLSPWGGRLVSRLGVVHSLRLACGGCAVGLLLVAVAPSATWILIALSLLGIPNSLIQPATNHVLAGIRGERLRGLAFGAVQSAIPAATMFAGVLLAVLGGGLSWRQAVGVVVVLIVLAQLLVRGQIPTGVPASHASRGEPRQAPTRGIGGAPLLMAMVLGGLFASTAATTLPSYVAASGQSAGLTAGTVAAGQILGSLSCILVRTLTAWTGATLSGPRLLTAVGALLTVGTLGYVLLSTASDGTFILGVVLAYAGGWGWNGLFNLAITRARPDSIAATTGLTQCGVFLGGVVGPLAFAALTSVGFGAGWLFAACAAGAAALAAAVASGLWSRDGVQPDPH